MSSCPTCDAPITPQDRFCGNCGIALAGYEQSTNVAFAASAERGEGPPSSIDGTHNDQVAYVTGEASEEELPFEGTFEPTIIDGPRHDAGAASAPQPAPIPVQDEQDNSVDNTVAGETSQSEDVPQTAAEIPVDDSPKPQVESSSELSSEPLVAEAESAGEIFPESLRRPTSDADADTNDERRYTGDQSIRTAGVGASGSRRQGAAQLDPGTVLISRYEIVRKIGGGGMGAVYYAKDRNLGDAPRAVKEMVQSQLDETQHEKAVNDFKRESMLLASLEHPSIPTIYDYFYDDASSRFYLVMRYISGGDFLARLRNAPGCRIDELTVSEWSVQVADVLEYLHNRRPPIIYRDLKPANLMIDGNSSRVMLIDFGIARWVAPQEKGVTAVGTMGYAPPELFSGKVEPRSDIYSLGATMFHLLTGADPQDNPLLIFDFNKFPRPRQIHPGLSNEIERILMRAVEYSPETRFRSAGEFRDTLVQHIDKLRSGAVTYGGVAYAEPRDAKTIGVEMVYCGFCGGRIAGEDVFCAHCGARQPTSAAAIARAARTTAKLVVAGTTELEATFQLQKDSSLVGRTDPQSNIFPDVDLSQFDPETKISRRHARIWRQGDTFLVEDLGSVNGTVINDSIKLGPRQPRTLEHGDRLRLGETTLHFLVG